MEKKQQAQSEFERLLREEFEAGQKAAARLLGMEPGHKTKTTKTKDR